MPERCTAGADGAALAAEAGADFYTGLEDAVGAAKVPGNLGGAVFEVRPPNLPADAVPIADDDLTVLGYRTERYSVIEILDFEGRVVHRDEAGLESPPLDPSMLIAEGAFAGLRDGRLSGLFFDGLDGPGDPGVR